MRFSKKILAGAVSAAMLLTAPSAFAQSSSTQGYSTPGGVVQTQLGHTPSQPNQPAAETSTNTPSSPAAAVATPSAKSSSKLPFTGLDIALVVAAGGLLLAMGFGIRRLSRSAEAA